MAAEMIQEEGRSKPNDPESFICPLCGAQSFNPNDVRNRYCGRCHVFVDDVIGRLSLRFRLHLEGEPEGVRGGGQLACEEIRPPDAYDVAAARASTLYRDETFPERACDYCGKAYRGPAVYCSLACAGADA